jgi:hypothetical protein
LATGYYAPGAGPAQPIAMDVWRRRNGMVPKFGHLSEAEIRSHVQIMDEMAHRAHDPDEPFEAQLRRYVAQLQGDAKGWDADEQALMAPILTDVEAGYVVDRGEIAHQLTKSRFDHGAAPKALPAASPKDADPMEKSVDEL